VEYRATAVQAYRLAGLMLERALADRTWTAALEQTSDFTSKPPAVILDVDETVLDNSESEERNVREGASYNESRWAEWCNERRATPIPGALEFTRAAAAKGVAVFYVTNRDRALEQATRDNLAKYGFPLDAARDTVLTRAERPEWAASEKSPRRALVAQDFRILLLIGDDFGDFVAGARGTMAARKALDEAHGAMWGVKWIALPNPLYGSWKTAAGQ
jgi:acid phosphatase